MDAGRKDEKYDLRKLRQELTGGPLKYDYPGASGKSSILPTTVSTPTSSTPKQKTTEPRSSGIQNLPQIKTPDPIPGPTPSKDDDHSQDDRDATHEEGGANAGSTQNSERVADGNGFDDGDEEMSSRFFSGFKDLYGFIKTSMATMKRQSKMMRQMDSSLKDLQAGFSKQQDEIAQLTSRNRDLEQQFLVVRLGESMNKMKGKEGQVDMENFVGQGLFQQNMGTPGSPRGLKKQGLKESRMREQDLKEITSRFEHQIADIHIDLSKKQANMDRQSFQIHTIKEKMETIDVREELKDTRKNVDIQGNSLKIIQGQVAEILSDNRINELQIGFQDLTSKFNTLQTRMNAWFTDLSAQFGALREESAQHKNMIYEKLYERVREDIARQTNRCFKELKLLSDHCSLKFDTYDSDMNYFREEVPRKVDREDLVTGISDVDSSKITNFRSLLVSQILQEIQDGFDGSLGYHSGTDVSFLVGDMGIPRGNQRSRESISVAPKHEKEKQQFSLSPELAQATFDVGNPKARMQAVREAPEPAETPNPGKHKSSGRASPSSRTISPEPSEGHRHGHKGDKISSSDAHPQIAPPNTIQRVVSEYEIESSKQTNDNLSSSPTNPELSRASSPEADASKDSSFQQDTHPNQAERLASVATPVAMTPPEISFPKEGRPQTTAHMSTHIQSVLTKFYGVMDIDSGEQLKALLHQLIQKLQKLHTVVNLKMFRHEGRIELEKKLSSSVFEQVMTNLLHQLKHNQLDINVEIPRNQVKKQGNAPKARTEKVPVISPAKRASTAPRREDIQSRMEYFPTL